MSYQDWDPGAQELYDHVPGSYTDSTLEAYFQYGWVEQGQPPEFRDAVRDAFFDALGIPDWEFPWEEWRIWMGYEDG